jgi:hypothetical protein
VSELAKALAAAQSEFPTIERSREVKVQTKTGGSYTFAYAPLDAILNAVRPVLTKNGLAVSQLLANVNGAPALKTMLLHEGGELLQDSCPLPTNGSTSAQEFGSLVTYMRRYALVAILGIATEEDDDGNHASGNTVETEGRHQAATPTEAFKPSELVIHWGPHKGKKLSEITSGQLWFFAEKWTLQDTPSEYDHLLKAAAVAFHSGDDSPITPDPDADIPF